MIEYLLFRDYLKKKTKIQINIKLTKFHSRLTHAYTSDANLDDEDYDDIEQELQ